MAKKTKKVKTEMALPQEDLLRPFWYDLPASFYLKVNEAAQKFGMNRKELVTRAVTNFIADANRERRQAVLPSTPEQDQLIKDFQRRAGALRWKDVSTEERRAFMKKMAAARWGTKKAQKSPPKKRGGSKP